MYVCVFRQERPDSCLMYHTGKRGTCALFSQRHKTPAALPLRCIKCDMMYGSFELLHLDFFITAYRLECGENRSRASTRFECKKNQDEKFLLSLNMIDDFNE